MPFYEYECPKCGYQEEVLQKITDKPLTKCPSCGKNSLRKLMSAPVFRLKGSGWYETDFKSDKENKRNLAGADKEDAKPESKPETKPETKGETKGETKEDSTAKAAKADSGEPATAKPAADKPAAQPAAKSTRRATSRPRAKHKGARKSRR